MDNFTFDITGDNTVHLKPAVALAMLGKHIERKAVGWRVKPAFVKPATDDDTGGLRPTTLIIYWSKREGMTPFLSEMNADEVAAVVLGWLKKVDYPEEPDHDGDNYKGFRLYCEDWGHVENEWEAIFGVVPEWALSGK